MTQSYVDQNPLLQPWTGPFEAPPFDRIEPGHFRPAFDVALKDHRAEIDAIAANPALPTFANTIEALERSGRSLDRVAKVFFNLTGAATNDELQAIEREIAPVLARHRSDIYLSEALFKRIDALEADEDKLGLSPEQARVLERYHLDFTRAGAGAPREAKARLAAIAERLATLAAEFGQNVLADEKDWLMLLDEEDLAGLPDFYVASASRIAAERGHPERFAVTLARSSIEPFLQFSARRDLRENAFRAWSARGESGGATDNRAIAAEMVRLRAERARLLGYESFAHYRLADTMAKTPHAALDLLESVWVSGVASARKDEEALQAIAASEGGNFKVAPWDWRYLAGKRRKAEFDFDEAELKPYLQLDRMIEAAFYAAGRLFGLEFVERFDLKLYDPDVRAWTVIGRDGAPVALFIGDYFARPSKRSGAWMSNFRGQQKLDGRQLPIVVNVMNFAKGGEGEASLLSFDDARTLFHEFGHALHGMLSDVTYPMISGTHVAGDFVEFPSQLYEHWMSRAGNAAALRAALQDGRAHARGAAKQASQSAPVQSGLGDGRVYRVGAGRSEAPSRSVASGCGRGRVREAGTQADRHARRDRHASPHSAFPAYFLRRLFGRLLQLSVVGGSRRRRLRGVRRERRHLRSSFGPKAP